jgi:peptidoglycan biosynthesis protein MviN/MurJ (putative lipid II flippase)
MSGSAQPVVRSEPPLLLERTSFPRSSAIVSASSFLAALVGGIQALLIAFIVGEGDKTDAFLAAYALYAVMALFAASLRSSIVPVLGAPQSEEAFRQRVAETLSRTLVLAGLASALMVVLAVPAGQLIANGLPADARWTTVLALVILAPAALFQLQSAAFSAALAAAHRFAFSASTYVVAGALSVVVSAILLELIGVLGAGFGMVAGAGLLLVAHGTYLRRFGIHLRPRLRAAADPGGRRLALGLVAGAAIVISLQSMLAISVASVSGDPGAITAYTYAYFAVVLMLTLSSPSLALVTLPALVARIGREGRDSVVRHFMDITPFAFAVLAPLLVLFAAYGEPMVQTVFEDSLSSATISLLFDLALVLSLAAVPTALVYLAAATSLALGHARQLIVIGAVTIAVHAAIVLPLSALGPRAVAFGQVGSATGMAAGAIVSAFGHRSLEVTAAALWRSLPAFLLAGVVALPRLLLSDPSLALSIVAALLSAVAYLTLVVLLWPAVGSAFTQLRSRSQTPI